LNIWKEPQSSIDWPNLPTDPDLQTQLAAVAESFRLIARERQRLIKAGLIEPETP
jgi:hypothetical protein